MDHNRYVRPAFIAALAISTGCVAWLGASSLVRQPALASPIPPVPKPQPRTIVIVASAPKTAFPKTDYSLPLDSSAMEARILKQKRAKSKKHAYGDSKGQSAAASELGDVDYKNGPVGPALSPLIKPQLPRALKSRLIKRQNSAAHKRLIKNQKMQVARKGSTHLPTRVAAGTIHMRRPNHGITGGGLKGVVDLRKVTITAHEVIDDPQNRPPLKPDKFIGKFTRNGQKPDPGNTSKCIPTGGNTVIASSQVILWGKHNHINGLHYCAPGSSPFPSPSSDSSASGNGTSTSTYHLNGGVASQVTGDNALKNTSKGGHGAGAPKEPGSGSGKRGGNSGGDMQDSAAISGDQSKNQINGTVVDHGLSLRDNQTLLWSNYNKYARGPLRGLDDGRAPIYTGEGVGTPLHALHLPAAHNAITSEIPGALVPKAMRRLVASPRPHSGSPEPEGTPDGANPIPTAFKLIPSNIGSHSERGSVLWCPQSPKPPSKGDKKSHSLKTASSSIKGHGKTDGGGDGSGLLGSYYTGRNFETLVFQRPDRNIDFNWTGGLPSPKMPYAQPFSVRWIGKIKAQYTEPYTIYTTSDDGVRLWINGKLLISNWTIHAASEDAAQFNMVAGQEYPIEVDYFEKNGLSAEIIKLYWESAHQPKEYVPESSLCYPEETSLNN